MHGIDVKSVKGEYSNSLQDSNDPLKTVLAFADGADPQDSAVLAAGSRPEIPGAEEGGFKALLATLRLATSCDLASIGCICL